MMMEGSTGLIDALGELTRQVREGTLQLLHVPESSWLTWSPPGTSNHILWHAGHALWLQDVLTIRPLTGCSELSRGWAKTFGQNCQPVSTTSEWPTDAEVRIQLKAQLQRVLELFAEHADTLAINAQEIPAGGGWPLLAGILHGWHDEALHQGEMYLLHKLCRAAK